MTIKNGKITLTPQTSGSVDGFSSAGTAVTKSAYVEKVSMSNYGTEGVPTEAEWVIMISATSIEPKEGWLVSEILFHGKTVSNGPLKIKKVFGPIHGTFWTYWEIYV